MIRKIFLSAGMQLLLAASLAFSQTVWQKYASNPVLAPSQEWEAANGVIGPRVIKVGNVYKMWYTGLGSNRQIGLATSTDGIHWTKTPNPVLSYGQPGNFDADHVDYASVLFHNNQYWMWYTGWNSGVRQIGLATSPDGVNWTKYSGNPVLTVGGSSTWEAQSVFAPCVIFDGNAFKMWYNASGQYVQAGGYAESNDGIHWNKHQNNPVLTPVPNFWESNAVGINTVVRTNGLYQMWYGGGDGSISRLGYAVSADGVHWERYGNNPILAPGGPGAWDSTTLGGFWVLRENNLFKMWYSGRSDNIWKIGYAESNEGSSDDFALGFDGSDDIVSLPPNFISTPTAITIEAWVKYSSTKTFMVPIYFEGAYVFYVNRFAVGTFTPYLDGASNNGNDFGYGANLNDNQWHHLAAVHAQGTTNILIDGAVVGSINESLYDINSLDRNSAIGAQFGGSEFHFAGLVDEVRVWNLARSAGEIQADMFRRLAGNESGLIGYWRCDEGEGQIVHDASPSGNDGQLGSSSLDDAADPQWVLANRINSDFQCFPLPASEAYGNINAGNRSHPDKVAYCFAGRTDDWYLSFEAYDIDTNQEVDILLNGVKIFDSPLTANNSWSGLLGVLLPDELIHDDSDNELIFDNTKNPPQALIWGVRRVSVDPFYALPSTAAYGKIQGGDQAHADKVVYFFSGRSGDLNLYYEVYDIDNVNELDVLFNGAKIHDETTTASNTWSRPRKLLLPDALVNDAGINVLIFDSPSNPPHQWYWGVRKVQVEATQNSSVALELSQSRIAEANMARDGRYLFDGRRTPPARLETDDSAVIDGATTIAPNGYLVVDLQAVRQFDYLQLYPEWNTQRYFTYRVEASQNGKDWQTVIDKSASFVHGIQLDELPATTQARFLRIRGASFMADVDALATAELSEEAYWQTHDDLINRADSTDLAIAELALFQKQSQLNVGSDASSLPASYDLAQNFPNPFNPATTIKFALPRPAKVKLAVYDLRGAIVRILEEGELPAGFHAHTFDTAGLASGIYLYKLQAGEFTATRKMVLAK